MVRTCCFALSLLALIAFTASADESASIRWHEDLDEGWAESKQRAVPLLLFVTTDNCVYCQRMKRQTYGDAKVVSNVNSEFVAVTANGGNIPDLVKRLRVEIYPTTVIIGPDAQVLDSINGYVRPDKLRTRLQSAMSRVQTAQRDKPPKSR